MEVDTETPEEDAAVAIVNDLLKQAAKIQQKHDLIVLRETTTRVAQARANFFASASRLIPIRSYSPPTASRSY